MKTLGDKATKRRRDEGRVRARRSCCRYVAWLPGRTTLHSGFTLIEIMLAVLLMALLASAAALSFSQPLKVARAQDAMELVRSVDQTARQISRRFGRPVSISFDLSRDSVARVEGSQQTYHAALPHGVRIRQVRTAGRRASDGEISIPCSALGISRTYAVHLSGSGVDQWMLVSGISGEFTTIKNEPQLDAIFAATATRAEAGNVEDGPDNEAPGDDAH